MPLKISIITPTFNSSKTISDTLISIMGQTYQNFEHIIIDGFSTDNTLKICNEISPNLFELLLLRLEKGICIPFW